MAHSVDRSSMYQIVPPLFRAQEASQKAFQTDWFPRFSAEYVQSLEGFKGTALRTYTQIQDGISELNDGFLDAVSFAMWKGDSALGWAIRPMGKFGYDAIGCHIEKAYQAANPINPINGKRHFVAIPRSVEKFLGDNIIYPLHTHGLIETSELLSGTNMSISQGVSRVLRRLERNNAELLNPESETTQFDYRVKTVISSEMNAYAVPAGGMVVFSQLVKELHGAIASGEIATADIKFADGSLVKVDLSNVTQDDVLAALLGHEMTHVASRHSIVSIFVNMIHTLLLNIGRIALIQYLRTTDEELQRLESMPLSELSERERTTLESKQAFYNKLNDVFVWIQDNIASLDQLFRSRKNEYEADVTGAYFAHHAEYDPLGAIYLQEFFSRKKGSLAFLHQHFEFLYTHPYAGNRKRALFAAIAEFAPEALWGRVSDWHLESNLKYDAGYMSPAIQFSHEAHTRLNLAW